MSLAVCLKKPAFYNPFPAAASDGVEVDAAAPKFRPPRISFLASVGDMANAMSASVAACGGVFEVADFGVDLCAPFASIGELFRVMDARPELGDRANAAYRNNLVYKNAYADGSGGAGVDEKRVIDLSPARLDTIVRVDSQLGDEFGAPLLDSVRFFDRVRTKVAPKLLEAAAAVVGDPTMLEDNRTNYRWSCSLHSFSRSIHSQDLASTAGWWTISLDLRPTCATRPSTALAAAPIATSAPSRWYFQMAFPDWRS